MKERARELACHAPTVVSAPHTPRNGGHGVCVTGEETETASGWVTESGLPFWQAMFIKALLRALSFAPASARVGQSVLHAYRRHLLRVGGGAGECLEAGAVPHPLAPPQLPWEQQADGLGTAASVSRQQRSGSWETCVCPSRAPGHSREGWEQVPAHPQGSTWSGTGEADG